MTTKYCPTCDIIVVVKEEDTICEECKSELKELTEL